MAGTTNAAAADKAGTKTAAEKVQEKVADKRKALGRGLASLLPGPRVVPGPPAASAPVPASGPATMAAYTPAAPVVVPAAAPSVVQDKVVADHESSHSGHIADNAGAPQHIEPIHRTERGGSGTHTPAGDSAPVDLQAVAKVGQARPYGDETPRPSDGQANEPVHAEIVAGPSTQTADTANAASTPESATGGEEVVQLEIDLIDKNPHQTRRRFNETALEELSQSIKVQGLLQPIVVRPDGKGRYKLILGERRLRATGMAGHATVPAIVKRVSEQQAAEMTLVENLQRQDLNPVEQADAFARLSQDFNMTQAEIGARVGMSRETVANYMRLLTLPSGVLEALVGGRLTFSHARVLLPLRDHVKIWSLAKRAIEERMTVQKLEDLVLGVPTKPGAPSPQGGARWVDPNVKAAQRSLEEILGMRVRIRDRHGRGRILIDYATVDDFQRVLSMLGGK